MGQLRFHSLFSFQSNGFDCVEKTTLMVGSVLLYSKNTIPKIKKRKKYNSD
ncbi:hypothetical protein MOSE0_H02124 [Monosporozyma servazzii]